MTLDAARELDRSGYGDTPVHRLDSRGKLIVALVFILCVSSFPKYAVSGLIPFFALPVALAILGHVPARALLRALAVASPFAVLVGIFNPVFDRAPMLMVGGLVVSGGVLSFLSILLRFLLCVGIVLALIATTSLPGLLHGLVQMRVPRPFVSQVQMLYRYLFVLVEEGLCMHRARILRQPNRRVARSAVAAGMLSSLLWRTWERGERIYRCMQARGFDGDFPALQRHAFRMTDAVFVAACTTACIAARFLPLSHIIGRLVTGRGAS